MRRSGGCGGRATLGLALAGLLYVICLTGTLSVFRDEFERWEQPLVPESPSYSAAQIARAVEQFRAEVVANPDKLYVVLPSESLPRLHLSADEQERYVRPDGTLDVAPVDGWTHMLVRLHAQLLLPETLGVIVTGSIGALLCALVLNGLLSHPNLVKDLFRWRRDRSDVLRHSDLHNRLGVWGSPFFLMFGLTGAFFGLVGVLAPPAPSAGSTATARRSWPRCTAPTSRSRRPRRRSTTSARWAN